MNRVLCLLIVVLVSCAIDLSFAQQTSKEAEGSDIRKQAPKGTDGPDGRKSLPPKVGSKRPFPTPSGPEEPKTRKPALKGTDGPGVHKSPSPKAGSRKPSSDTIPAPIGSEGPEMRKGTEKKGP
jgi:hypothetical protein